MEDLQTVHSVLHLIFHRNKNQHHRTKWWKWLSMLKRATQDLAQSHSVASSEAQKRHLAILIPKCYVAFSTVVADNQFSTLGVVLLAALARLSKITGITQELKKKPSPANRIQKSRSVIPKEDLGERIRRVETASTHPAQICRSDKADERAAVKEKPVDKTLSDVKSAKKKKKKKKKNAIDDLFSDLL